MTTEPTSDPVTEPHTLDNSTETTESVEKVSEDVDVANKEEKTQDEEAGHKVFVGNLSFQTSEQQLADFFNKTGKVLKANIISRGNRSLGYGFVALETEDDAKKVVDELNRQELDGRQINVEYAKPKSEGALNNNNAGKYYSSPYRGRGRFPFRGRSRGRGRGRGGRGRGRGGWGYNSRRYNNRSNDRGDRGDRSDREENETAATTTSDVPALNDTRKPRGSGGGYRGRSRGRSGYRGRGRGRGRGRFYNRRRNYNMSNRNTEPSKTDIFVANLPFTATDENLKETFKEYDVKSAHVVHRRDGSSKGFGFVELASEEEQTKVIEAAKTFKSEGRELVIRIAMSNQHIPTEEDAADKIESADAETDADAAEKKE
jgi:RNA recognition motif-containing protein